MNMQTEYANTDIIMRGYEIANYVTHNVKNLKLHLHVCMPGLCVVS